MATRTNPPFTQWSDTDHAGPVIVVATLCLLYWMVAGAGQQILSLTSGLRFTWADGLFTFSMVMGFIQFVMVLVAASYGLGKSATVSLPGDVSTAESIYKVSNLFYILTLGLIKASATCFTANLTVKNLGSLKHITPKHMVGLYGSVGLAAVWTIGSCIAIGYPCSDYGGRANRDGMCMGTVSRWVGIFVGDAITDIAIVAYAASVIWTTKASFGKRLTWYIPFLVRACVPVWSGLRLLTINREKLTRDPLLSLWLFIAMSQVQVLLALIGAASPVLKRAMADLVTNYGAQTDSQNRSGGNSFALKYLKPRSNNKSNDALQTGSGSGGSKGHMPFGGSVVSGNPMTSRSRNEEKIRGDGDSQEGIIRQDEYEVNFFHTESPERETPERETVGEESYRRYR